MSLTGIMSNFTRDLISSSFTSITKVEGIMCKFSSHWLKLGGIKFLIVFSLGADCLAFKFCLYVSFQICFLSSVFIAKSKFLWWAKNASCSVRRFIAWSKCLAKYYDVWFAWKTCFGSSAKYLLVLMLNHTSI